MLGKFDKIGFQLRFKCLENVCTSNINLKIQLLLFSQYILQTFELQIVKDKKCSQIF